MPRRFKLRAVSSPILPAPISIAVLSSNRSKILPTRLTAIELAEIALCPIKVSLRTRFATENALWKAR